MVVGVVRYYEQLLAKTAADWAQGSCRDDQMTEDERAEAEQVGHYWLGPLHLLRPHGWLMMVGPMADGYCRLEPRSVVWRRRWRS